MPRAMFTLANSSGCTDPWNRSHPTAAAFSAAPMQASWTLVSFQAIRHSGMRAMFCVRGNEFFEAFGVALPVVTTLRHAAQCGLWWLRLRTYRRGRREPENRCLVLGWLPGSCVLLCAPGKHQHYNQCAPHFGRPNDFTISVSESRRKSWRWSELRSVSMNLSPASRERSRESTR